MPQKGKQRISRLTNQNVQKREQSKPWKLFPRIGTPRPALPGASFVFPADRIYSRRRAAARFLLLQETVAHIALRHRSG